MDNFFFNNNFNDSASRELLMQDFIDQYELYPDNISPISYPESYDSVSPVSTTNQDPNTIVLTGETRIEYLGNIKVWELASAFMFVSVFLLFIFFYVVKRLCRASFDANEYSIIEKELIKEGISTNKIPTLVSAKLINCHQPNYSLKSLSIHSRNSTKTNSQTTSTSSLPDSKIEEIVLSINNLAFTNQCLILDEEDEQKKSVNDQIKKLELKNDSIV